MHNDSATRNRRLFALAVAGLLVSACSSDTPPPFTGTTGTGGTGMSGGAAGAGIAGSTIAGSGSGGTATGGSAGSGSASSGAGGASGGGGSTGGSSGTAGSTTGGAGGSDGGLQCPPPDFDSDGDGTSDCRDDCPFDKNKIVAGKCGCGVAENDSDGDGTVDCIPGHFYEAENGQLSPSADAGAIEDASSGADGAAPTGPFTIGADVAASAGHYIVAPAGSSESQPGSARASYDINITKADMYVIWGRFYSPDRVHNCVWARVDGGVWSKWRGTTGETWFWYHFHKEGEWATPLLFQLSMGSHTLEIANCTDNTKLDRLYITAGGDKPPGDITICNPPHTVEIGGQCVSSCGQLGGTSCDALACTGQTLLPAYDCAVCCTPSEAGTADAASSVDMGVDSTTVDEAAVDTGTTQ